MLPVIGDTVGKGFTVTTLIATPLQLPLLSENEIVAVPLLNPVTTPVADTLAAPVLLHTPPDVESVIVTLLPTHIDDGPCIDGTYNGFE